MPPSAARRAWHLQDAHGHYTGQAHSAGVANVYRSLDGFPTAGQIEQVIIDGRGTEGSFNLMGASIEASLLTLNNPVPVPIVYQELYKRYGRSEPGGTWRDSWEGTRSVEHYMHSYRTDWGGVLTRRNDANEAAGVTAWLVMGYPPGGLLAPSGGSGGVVAAGAYTEPAPIAPGQSGAAPGPAGAGPPGLAKAPGLGFIPL
jgi:hypothetical protein